MTHIYLGAVAFGVTLLVASFVLGGKDVDHGGGGHLHGDTDGADGAVEAEVGLGWAPITSLRFWVFFLTFGGGVGLALTALHSGRTIAAVGAGGVGWVSGALAVSIIRRLTRTSVSSELAAGDLVGVTGTLVLPAAPARPGKVRVEVKGRAEDFVAEVVPDGGELASGTPVMIVAEGDQGALLVAKHEM